VSKSGSRCRGLHTMDPRLYDHVSQCSGTRMNRYGLQLFGFSKSPSSNRITRRSLSSPRPSLSCDAPLDTSCSLSSTSTTPSSFSTSFSLSNSLSNVLKYAALELSSATPNQPHHHHTENKNKRKRTATSRTPLTPQTPQTLRRHTPNKRNRRRHALEAIAQPMLLPGISAL
jgi:hypothetical protein